MREPGRGDASAVHAVFLEDLYDEFVLAINDEQEIVAMNHWRVRVISIVAILAVALVLLTACGGSDDGPVVAAVAAGDAAPGFELPTAEGGQFDLQKNVQGKPVLLYFSMGPG